TALPPIFTRSPSSEQNNSPPRHETCRAKSSFLPSFSAQYGISVQCAEPVTGSSGTPTSGAKNRDTKSDESPFAVTITACVLIFCSASKFGLIALILSSL